MNHTHIDIAVMNVITSKTIVGQGFTLQINATVQNQGNKIELFRVIAYADQNAIVIGNEIIIEAQNVTLKSGNSTTITFTWNTTGIPYGNYTISSAVTPLLGETDTMDNTLIDGWVRITGVGDVNGDSTVNVLDIILVLINVGPVPPKPPQCDINGDNKIDVLDLILVLINVGPV